MKNTNKLFSKFPIIAVYLFGSKAAKKRTSPISDYDFGVLLSKKAAKSSYLDIKLKLTAELVGAAACDHVDVVLLNEAPLLLKYEIIKNGKLIYDNNSVKRAQLLFETLREYLDWDYLQKIMSKSLIKRTALKGLNV
ncbi:nucleotidyltransferase domain-containing protein [Candidatus Saganbacteria bacterium]|nr:nucleotidyltransferase domain-containing protein [Candidatus Saganbacteria bacterium]